MGLDVYVYRKGPESNNCGYCFSPEIWHQPDCSSALLRSGWGFKRQQAEEDKYKGHPFEAVHYEDDSERDYADEKIELPSSAHPKHLFKVGYFRSSYNQAGYNSVLESLGLPTLYEVVKPPAEEYRFTPDWEACLKRADEAAQKFDEFLKKPEARYSQTELLMPHKVFSKTQEAMAAFFDKAEQYKPDALLGSSFSSQEGDFFLEGQKIYALMQVQSFLGNKILLVTDGDYQWYRQALEIVQETFEWVLCQPNPEDFCMHWSG